MRGTIHTRLTMAFIGLAVIPLLLVGSALAWQTVQVQRVQALQREQQVTQRVAVEVDTFVNSLERELLEIVRVHDLMIHSLDGQELMLTQLLAFEPAFAELSLLDGQGWEKLRLARLGVVTAADLVDRSQSPEFVQPMVTRTIYFSPIWFDETTGEPMITASVPLENLRTGEAEGVLVAVIALKSVWDLIASIDVQEGEAVYIVNEGGSVIAHRNPSLVLRNTQFIVPETDGVYEGLMGTAVFLSSSDLHFGDRRLKVVSERTVTSALALSLDTIKVTVVMLVAAFIIALIVGVLVVRRIVQPIQQLAVAAHEIRLGNLSTRVPVPNRTDEIRELAEAFNRMASQLEVTMAGLEQNIQKLQQAEKTLAAYAAELEQKNSELQSFAYVASHDLQEPLRKIRTFSDRMQATYAGTLDERGLDYLRRMQNAAERMQVLIHDLLLFSRVTTQAQPVRTVNLKTVLDGVLSDLEVHIEETQAQVVVGDLPTIDADPTQMRQLFQNLLSNALKFHQPDQPPVVQVNSEKVMADGRDPCCWQISVTDNGIGFEEKYADRIFTIFQRLHGRHDYVGTGVGLAICRKIVDRHHGHIIAHSQPGQGATFIVTLPERQEANTSNGD
ncbi:MAG TPA: ATP-binding protein [Chloroflexota bacterium]|nr:ATP-binding protein [Chloroflexota bacterium]HUM68604.1 ATP-binding protein [Chloroflexota bacterium]